VQDERFHFGPSPINQRSMLISLLRVSVVVCTFSKERATQVMDCLASVKRQMLKPYEIILVLDPDLDLGSYSSRVPSGVSIIKAKSRGLSNARNAGVEAVKGDIIAFIDDDATADGNWLSNLAKNFHDGMVAGAGGYVKAVWENGRPAWFPEELDWVVGCSHRGGPSERRYVRNPVGCNMAFRKQVFRKIGLFRSGIGRIGNALIGSEEAEFSIRLSNAMPSARIVFDPSAVVYHRVAKIRRSFTYLLRRSYYEGVSKALIERAHPSTGNSFFVERMYLRYLLQVSVPGRLTRIYDWRKLAELFTILASMILVFSGYFAKSFTAKLVGQRR
jgi:glycosyltransferase involved in cell wall biosynthesis